MTNKKETLIEMLRGSIANVHATCDLFEDVSIYDDTGHVDLSFLEVMLKLLNEVKSAELCLTRKLAYLLAPDFADETEGKSSGKQDGKKLSAEEVLKQCTFKDNMLYLPNVQLSKKTYADVKVWIEEAGGKWTGGKVQGFSFDFDATRVAGILMEGKRCNLAKDFQFFATPPEVADWLVSLAGDFSPDCKVLEPSAGTGAIIDAIHRVQPDVVVDCYELMPENKEKLSKLDHIRLLGDDFTQAEHSSEYDLIVANPPFSKNQDIRHVIQMYHDLKPGGTVAAITSRHWQQASEKVCKDFRAFLEEVSAQVYEIEEGAFKKSGTGVGTIAIVINKK